MKKKFIMVALLGCIGMTALAQEVKKEEPKGKAIVQVFGNFTKFHHSFYANCLFTFCFFYGII